MQNVSSGCYVIDDSYNIVLVNETCRAIYPQVEIGKKCHACLMGLDAPCPNCPVAAGRHGPNTYLDPIRNIAETVDALDVELEGHGPCHALVFSTVGEPAVVAASLPRSEEELQALSLIQALAIDFEDVFSVNLSTGTTRLFRHAGSAITPVSDLYGDMPYEETVRQYAARHVHPDDRQRMVAESSLAGIRALLSQGETGRLHYRVILHGKTHHYFRKLVRVGPADAFTYVVVGVGCEDEAVRSFQERQELEQNLLEVESDSLTGLYTREAFRLHAAELLAAHPGEPYDYCICKMENLSTINRQYGRATGNRLLGLIGRLLKEWETDNNCIGYWGGGVFASYTPTDPREVRMPTVLGFRDSILTASGIKNLSLKWAIYVEAQAVSVEEAHERTYYALSTVLSSAGTDYVEFDHAMMEQMAWNRSVEARFDNALSGGQFEAWFQPKFDARTQHVAGAEALVRWRMPDGSLVLPGRFIPALESCAKVAKLDAFMFRATCRFQQRLREMGLVPVPVSVNLSRASLYTEDIAPAYAAIAAEYGLSPADIPLEITESAAVKASAILGLVNRLAEQGFRIDMDDFGTGYSSLASLQLIPFTGVKLDKALIDHIGRPSSDLLLKHTLAFIKETGKQSVAEGVETIEQYLFLKALGCDLIQGYYFSRPLSEADFVALLRRDQQNT